MAKRYVRYADRKARDDRLGWIIIGAAVLALATVFAAGYWGAQPKRDPKTGCPIGINAALPAHTIVLIDQTDALPRKELNFTRDLIQNEYFWLPLNGKLTVRNISEKADDSQDAIAVCRMLDSSEANGITNNPAAVKKEFEAKVGNSLNMFLDGLEAAPVQNFSPIVEAVSNVFEKTDFNRDVKQRRLIILSDMAQHSLEYSQYIKKRSYRFHPSTKFLDDYKVDMNGVDIRVQYVRRAKLALQGERHKSFWKDYFTAQGASVAIGHALTLGEADDRSIWHQDSLAH